MDFKQHKVVIAVASAITLGLGSVAIAASVNPSKTVNDNFTSNVELIKDRGNSKQQASHDKAAQILRQFKDGDSDEKVLGEKAASELHSIVGDNTEMNEIVSFAVPASWEGDGQDFTMGFATKYSQEMTVAIAISYIDKDGNAQTYVTEATVNPDGTISFFVPADVMEACKAGGASLAVFNAEGALA